MKARPEKLCALLGCELPLLAAPMLGCTNLPFAQVAAATGATGCVPITGMSPAKLDALLAGAAGKTSSRGALMYNAFSHVVPPTVPSLTGAWATRLAPLYQKEGLASPAEVIGEDKLRGVEAPFSPEVLDVLVRHKARSVSFHFGLPPPEVWKRVKASGIVTSSSATTLKEAAFLCEQGVDVIIAQGYEAGGHRGVFLEEDVRGATLAEQLGTFALVAQVRQLVGDRAYVVAAGGIVDEPTMRAAMALGADGVLVGSAFMLCKEATTSALHRAALERAKREQLPTQLTTVFSGRPARGLVNGVMREVGSLPADAAAFPYGRVFMAPLRQAAEKQGRDDYSSLWCGQNVSGLEACTVAEKVDRIAGWYRTSASSSKL